MKKYAYEDIFNALTEILKRYDTGKDKFVYQSVSRVAKKYGIREATLRTYVSNAREYRQTGRKRGFNTNKVIFDVVDALNTKPVRRYTPKKRTHTMPSDTAFAASILKLERERLRMSQIALGVIIGGVLLLLVAALS